MATAEQVKALIRSHAQGDDGQFYAVAMQVAARAARGGQSRFAQELRGLIDAAKAAQVDGSTGRHLRPVPVTQPRGELAGLLSVSYPKLLLSDLALEAPVMERLKRILTEQRQQDRLRHRGYDPLRKIMLTGPPGTGKTMSANVLAGELHLPLFLIRLESVLTKFMGETAAKLRLVFDAMDQTRGVYLFDEVDALAGDRGSRNDVGEIRRVLNSFLQFLEQDSSLSLIVATTNHQQLLDRAVFRRFDTVIDYPLPSPAVAERIMRRRLTNLHPTGLSWRRAALKAEGLSHSDITLACEQAAKDALLSGHGRVTTAALIDAIEDRRAIADRRATAEGQASRR